MHRLIKIVGILAASTIMLGSCSSPPKPSVPTSQPSATTVATTAAITQTSSTTATTTTTPAIYSIATPPTGTALVIVSGPTSISRDQTTTITIHGKPHTEYQIRVVHNSIVTSTAQGLEPKTSDASGNVSWTWTIDSSIGKGPARATITGGGASVSHVFSVY